MEDANEEIKGYKSLIKLLDESIIKATKRWIIKMADDEEVSLNDVINFVNSSLKNNYLLLTDVGLLMMAKNPRGLDTNYSNDFEGILALFGQVINNQYSGDICCLDKKWHAKKGDIYVCKFDRITQSYK